MFFKYFLTFSTLLLLAVLVSGSIDENQLVEETEVDEIDIRNPIALRLAIQALKAAFKWAAKHCLEEAANHCKQHWKNPKNLFNCGKNFFAVNKGRCVSG